MKKNWIARFVVMVAVLTLITGTMVSGTFAKYTTQVSGSDSVVVAKWKADFGDGGTTTSTGNTTFNLFNTASDTGVTGGTIAPGTSGSFTANYDTSGTQVKRHVNIIMGASNLSTLSYLKFYKGTSPSGVNITADVLAGNGVLLNQDIAADAAGTGAVDVYWVWPFEGVDAGQDAADTADGITPITNGVVTITFSAIQLDN